MRVFLERVIATFRRRRLEHDLDDEVRAHVELLAAEYERRGMSPQEARHAARRSFGGVEQVKERYRDRRGLPWIDDLRRDLRYAIRGLARSCGFAAIALLVVSLGIGANTAIFSLLDVVLLRPLPVRQPDALVIASHLVEGRRMMPFTAYQFRGLRAHRDVLSDLAAFRPLPLSVAYRGDSDLVAGQLVSGSYFDALGVPAVLGRTLTAADDTASDRHPVAVISYGFWQRRFGGEPDAIGQSIDVNGQPFTIVGVTPRGFFGTEPGRSVDVTVALSMQQGVFGNRSLIDEASEARWLYLVGRLAPGVTHERAQAVLALSWDQIQMSRPRRGRSPSPNPLILLDGSRGMYDLRDRFSVPLRILMAMVGLVLLIACANLATLLIARSGARRQEIALRLGLGAGRGRLLRQLLTESLLLSFIGGVAGIGLAYVGSDALVQIMSRGAAQPIVLDLTPNLRTLTFALIASLASGLVFGVVPSLRAARFDIVGVAKTASSPAHAGGRWSHALIATQVTLSLLLLVEAGLFTRSLSALRGLDTGFTDGTAVLLATIRTRANTDQISRLVALFKELSARDAAVHARSQTFTMDLPLSGGLSFAQNIDVPGRTRDNDEAPVWFNFVGPRFFETMGIAIEGRDVRAQDDATAPPVAVISQSLARRFFPGGRALGRRIQTSATEVEVVGISADVKYTGLMNAPTEMIYLPFLQGRAASNVGLITFAVRAERNADETAAALRQEVRRIAPDLLVSNLSTLEERKDALLARERMIASLSLCFGTLALFLGGVGLYGTLSYAVTRRTGELGVRIALGADALRLMRMVVRESLGPVVAGLVVGLPLAFAAGRVSERLLFDVRGSDPATYVMAVAILVLSAAFAAFVPARRAALVDPVVALRAD